MDISLVDSFNNACRKAKVINDLPNLTPTQYEQIFYHVSNEDMATTIRTIEYAYQMVKKHSDTGYDHTPNAS
jgi:hypothetical protein